MKKFFLLFVFLLTYIQPVSSATWEQFSEKSYIDTDSIEENVDFNGNSNEYYFWTKNLNNKNDYFIYQEKKYGKKIWYTLVKTVINCKEKKIANKSVYLYDLKSHVIDNYDFKDFEIEWESIPPESVGESLCDFVCKSKYQEDANDNNNVEYILSSYLKELQKRIKMNFDYPPNSNPVTIDFEIAKDGELLSYAVHKSSKNKKTDNQAIDSIRLASPYRPLPVTYTQSSLKLRGKFDYNDIEIIVLY